MMTAVRSSVASVNGEGLQAMKIPSNSWWRRTGAIQT